MPSNQSRQEILIGACHTAVSVIGLGSSVDDYLDAVAIQTEIQDEEMSYVVFQLYTIGVDISELCEGHETTRGPAGFSDYCDGVCQTRRTL